MSLFTKNTIALAVLQAAQGTAIALTGAHAVHAKDVTLTPFEIEYKDRNFLSGTFGSEGKIPGKIGRSLKYMVEAAGAGTAGLAPAWGVQLQGCEMLQTVNALVDVVYTPLSGSGKFLSQAVNLDGQNYKLKDSKGDFTLSMKAGDVPDLAFNFKGIPDGEADAAAVVPDYSAWVDGISVTKQNTPIMSIGGVANICVESFSLNFANDIKHTNRINCEGIIVTDRLISGQIVVEAALFAQWDWRNAVKLGTKVPITIQHGTVAGNIVMIEIDLAQLMMSGEIGDQDGLRMLTFNFEVVKNTAGVEGFRIRVK